MRTMETGAKKMAMLSLILIDVWVPKISIK